MTKEEVFNRLENIFTEVMDDDTIHLKETTIISGGIGDDILPISSIDFVQVVVEAEEEFGIIIDFDIPIETVGDFINIILSSQKDNEGGQ